MPEFRWTEGPEKGSCLGCGASACERGFVNMIGEVNITRDGYEITGVADAIYCAHCLEQSSRYVGCASRDEVEAFSYEQKRNEEEIVKLKDEVQAWTQRYERLQNMLLNEEALSEKLPGSKKVESNPEVNLETANA